MFKNKYFSKLSSVKLCLRSLIYTMKKSAPRVDVSNICKNSLIMQFYAILFKYAISKHIIQI